MPSRNTRHWRQFTMRDLLITISIAAIALVVVPLAPFFGVTAAGISLYGALALPRMDHGRRSLTLTLVLLAVLVPVEFGCGLLAYHTIGEIMGGLYRLLLLLNLVFLAAFALGSRRFAIVGILGLAVCIVPYHVTLGHRWWLIHHRLTREPVGGPFVLVRSHQRTACDTVLWPGGGVSNRVPSADRQKG